MKAVLLALAGVIAGLLVASVLVFAVEIFSGLVHPPPEDFGGTHEEICRLVEQYPPWVLAVAVGAWAVAAFTGTWTAQRIGGVYSAAIVGLLVLASLLFNLAQLPYPIWFRIANLIVIPLALIAGSRVAARRRVLGAGPTG